MNGNMNLGKRVSALEKGVGADIKKEISDLQEAVTTAQKGIVIAQEEISNLENKVNSGHVYSTEEKVVGTWIDGKPIYQKTLFIADSISNTETQSPSNIENVDNVIELNGFCNWNDGNLYTFPIPYLSRAFDQAIQIFYNHTTKSIHIGTNITITNVYSTIKYTKKTDNPTQ